MAGMEGSEDEYSSDDSTDGGDCEDHSHAISNTPLSPLSSLSSGSLLLSRRQTIVSFAGVVTSGVVAPPLKHVLAGTTAYAAVAADDSRPVGGTVAIVGGNGRTGMTVAKYVADPTMGNMNAVTLTRTGKDPYQIVKLPEPTKANLRHYDKPFDVVRDSQQTITETLKELSPSAVVYAASASKQGGTAREVDDLGVEKVATACKEIGCDSFVLVSALAVDRPDSKSFQITNTLGGNFNGIMDAKLSGEQKTKKILGKSKSRYVIIRPGVLMSSKTTGPSGLELNQGDTIGGGISRDELAGLVVGAIRQSRSLKGGTGITVEAYRKSTATKLQPEFAVPSGNELTVTEGDFDSYRELFANAKAD